MKLRDIPKKLLERHPDLTKKEIKIIVTMILASRAYKIRRGYILDFTVTHLGRFRTHKSKKVKRYNKNKIKDKKRKRLAAKKKEFQINNLLW